MSVARCQAEMTTREMRAWLKRIEREMDRPSRDDWYSAMIAKTVYDLLERWAGKSPSREIKSFLLEFTSAPKDKSEITPERAQSMADLAKAIWAERTRGADVTTDLPTETE